VVLGTIRVVIVGTACDARFEELKSIVRQRLCSNFERRQLWQAIYVFPSTIVTLPMPIVLIEFLQSLADHNALGWPGWNVNFMDSPEGPCLLVCGF